MDPIIQQPSPTTGTPAAAPNGAAEEEAPVGVTVEERDAYWKRRISGKDRAHAAAEQALREELESWKAKATATPGADGQPGNGAANSEIEALKRQIAERDTLYGRKTKYPSLVGKVSDATIMAAEEAELARLNALFDDSADGGTFIAPTAPKRTPSGAAKRVEDMTKDELLVELARETERMKENRQ